MNPVALIKRSEIVRMGYGKKQVSELETPKLCVELGKQIRARPDVEACEFWMPPLK